MIKKALIKKTLKTISQLPQDKIKEVNDYADFILKKYDEEVLCKGMQRLASDSKAFDILEQEDELYSPGDLKEKYK